MDFKTISRHLVNQKYEELHLRLLFRTFFLYIYAFVTMNAGGA